MFLVSLGFPDFEKLLCGPFPLGEDTVTVPDDPVPHVGDDAVLGQLPRRQLLAELTVVRDAGVADDLVVRPPGEIRGELFRMVEERVEMGCQLGGLRELEGVNI